ncbi:unnamed protein product [Parajaminaea phylloscopi]
MVLYAVADLCLIPMATPTTSVGTYIAECQRVLDSMKSEGIKYEASENCDADHARHRHRAIHACAPKQMHGYGTNLEGPFPVVCTAIERCHEAVHNKGALRISSDIRLGTRIDKPAPGAVATENTEVKGQDWTHGLGENERKRESVRRILAGQDP